ncbi:MAG: LytTR family DNA-binding domain-containing protein, partial [Oscillospiraceae bacterium]|nr:LytTR family DNA-binding domain-containing protein [Oscillospiraceae bacterium]
ALIDDEQIYLDEITKLCQEFGEKNRLEIEIVPYSDGESFLRSNDTYSVVFMDIYMNGMDGILTAKNLRMRDNGCILIFLTASTEHMPEAFFCHAFEYIIKPFSPQRVKDVLNDVMKMIPVSAEYVELYSNRQTIRIALSEILSAVTDAHYLDVEITNGTSFRCRMTIGQFIKRTNNDPRFMMINKGIIVNADYITDFENNCCILENGARFPIRVRNRLKIEQAVRDYNFDKIRSRQRYGR